MKKIRAVFRRLLRALYAGLSAFRRTWRAAEGVPAGHAIRWPLSGLFTPAADAAEARDLFLDAKHSGEAVERWHNGIRRDWWPRCIVLFASLLAFSSADAQVYRLKDRVVRQDSVVGDRVFYTVLHSEATPSTAGRRYAMALSTFTTEYKLAYDTVPPVVEPKPDTIRPAPVDTSYPNRPAGLTLIGRNVGTVKDAGGAAFGIAGFGPWYDHNVASDIAVVADPSNPTGSGKSLRFTYPSDDSKAGSATAGRFDACPCRELYILVRIYHESGFADFGNKFFYVGAQQGQRLNTSSPTQFYTDRNGSRLRIVNQNGQSAVAAQADNAIALGRWQTLEFWMVGESAVGAGDGRARMWIDGRQVASSDAVRWGATAFDGMEWYAEVNRIPTTSYYRLGELYIAGNR